MVLTKSGLGAALLGGLLAVLHLAPGYVTARLIAGDGVALPWPATTAELIVLSQGLLNVSGVVGGIGAVFLLGYWAGGRLEVRQHSRQFLLVVGLGGLGGYVAVNGLLFVYALLGGTQILQSEQSVVTAVVIAGRAVGVLLQFAVCGFAGAAFATLGADARRSDAAPSRPLE